MPDEEQGLGLSAPTAPTTMQAEFMQASGGAHEAGEESGAELHGTHEPSDLQTADDQEGAVPVWHGAPAHGSSLQAMDSHEQAAGHHQDDQAYHLKHRQKVVLEPERQRHQNMQQSLEHAQQQLYELQQHQLQHQPHQHQSHQDVVYDEHPGGGPAPGSTQLNRAGSMPGPAEAYQAQPPQGPGVPPPAQMAWTQQAYGAAPAGQWVYHPAEPTPEAQQLLPYAAGAAVRPPVAMPLERMSARRTVYSSIQSLGANVTIASPALGIVKHRSKKHANIVLSPNHLIHVPRTFLQDHFIVEDILKNGLRVQIDADGALDPDVVETTVANYQNKSGYSYHRLLGFKPVCRKYLNWRVIGWQAVDARTVRLCISAPRADAQAEEDATAGAGADGNDEQGDDVSDSPVRPSKVQNRGVANNPSTTTDPYAAGGRHQGGRLPAAQQLVLRDGAGYAGQAGGVSVAVDPAPHAVATDARSYGRAERSPATSLNKPVGGGQADGGLANRALPVPTWPASGGNAVYWTGDYQSSGAEGTAAALQQDPAGAQGQADWSRHGPVPLVQQMLLQPQRPDKLEQDRDVHGVGAACLTGSGNPPCTEVQWQQQPVVNDHVLPAPGTAYLAVDGNGQTVVIINAASMPLALPLVQPPLPGSQPRQPIPPPTPLTMQQVQQLQQAQQAQQAQQLQQTQQAQQLQQAQQHDQVGAQMQMPSSGMVYYTVPRVSPQPLVGQTSSSLDSRPAWTGTESSNAMTVNLSNALIGGLGGGMFTVPASGGQAVTWNVPGGMNQPGQGQVGLMPVLLGQPQPGQEQPTVMYAQHAPATYPPGNMQ